MERVVKKSPKIIAVDLTPVLPGGENGGVKVFVLNLLLILAKLKPNTRFIILTRESSHEELAVLDRQNMIRVMVLADSPDSEISRAQPKKDTLWLERTLNSWKRSLIKRIRRKELARKSRSILHEMGVDLYYCPFTSLEYAEPGIPAVCTIHDLQHKSYPNFFSAGEVKIRDRLFKDACQRSTVLSAISEYSRSSAIAHGHLNPAIIRTIYHRMAYRIHAYNGRDYRLATTLFANLGLEKREYLIYPANFWQHKNHEMLLMAFEMASRDGLNPKMKLVCTGAPSDRQRFLIEKTLIMGLSERVIFPGYLPNSELAVLLSNSSGMIFPSLYEGFGLPVIEAMAEGIPVACSNARALPEVSAGAALLFNPERPEEIALAMVSLTNNEPLRLKLIKDGLQLARDFSDLNRMAEEYWALFEDAMFSWSQQASADEHFINKKS